MSLADDLLEQASHLSQRERKRPRQASLRRAISSAYYALFHLLVDEATNAVVAGADTPGLRQLTQRAFEHGVMRDASRSFSTGKFPQHVARAMANPRPSNDLQFVATVFENLQQTRHDADYDTHRRFTRSETQLYVHYVRAAFSIWSRIRKTPEARQYLHALFAWRSWKR